MVTLKFVKSCALMFATLFIAACSFNLSNLIPPSAEDLKRLAEYQAETDRYIAEMKAKADAQKKNYETTLINCEKMQWTPKAAFEKQKCLNKADVLNPDQIRRKPVLEALHTQNLKAALDFAEGKISKDRFLLTKDENLLKVEEFERKLSEERLRLQILQENAERQQQEAERARKAEAWQRFSQSMQQQNYINQQNSYQQQMLMQQNRMRTTNCNAFGNNLNCTTY